MKIYDTLETTKFHYGCGKEFIGKDDWSSVWACRWSHIVKGILWHLEVHILPHVLKEAFDVLFACFIFILFNPIQTYCFLMIIRETYNNLEI